MGQPVMDTLRLSNRLRESGVEQTQAEAMAQALGTELDEHVAVRKDLDAGFGGVRTELNAKIDDVRTELKAEIALLRTEFNTKFNWGFGLMLAFLSVLVGIGLIDLNRPTPAPTPAPATTVYYVPWAPGAAVAHPASGPIAPVPGGAPSGEPPPVPPAPS